MSRETADEPEPAATDAALVAYRAFSDLAGKGAFFVVTLVAARRLSQDAFGLFSLGTTVGWIAAVATDFGIQLHLAREVAQRPAGAARAASAPGCASACGPLPCRASAPWRIGLVARPGRPPAFSRAIFLFTLVYVVSGLIEFLHYFYRGLSRSDVESTLTLWQRLAMLVLARRRAVVATRRDGCSRSRCSCPRWRILLRTAPRLRQHGLRR